MQKVEQNRAIHQQVMSEADKAGLTDEQKNNVMDRIQAEVLSKGLPLTFLFATLALIIKSFAG